LISRKSQFAPEREAIEDSGYSVASMSLDRPRFRRDLEARPVFAEGQDYVEVWDRVGGASFRFYDFEYQVALAFDGLALDKVIPWVKLATGLALDVGQLREFAERLDELGFLERADTEEVEPPAADQPAEVAGPSGTEDASAAGVPSAGVEPTGEGAATGDAESVAENEPWGPPAPDSVVMHPAEVVGETPPPVPVATASKTSTDQPTAEGDQEPGRDGRHPWARDEDTVGDHQPSPASREDPAAAEEKHAAVADISRPAPVDSAAFPVLPVTRPAPTSAPSVPAPPTWTTPWPVMTPAPSTLGPSLFADRTSERRRIRRSFVVFGTLGVLAAAALLAITLPFLLSARRPPPVEVRTVVASPGTVYRYFDGAGTVAPMASVVLKFPIGGKVTRIAGAGSTVAGGDVVAAVEAARPLLDLLARQRERLAYYRQMAEAMHEVGSSTEEERQSAKLESRSARIAQTLSELARVAVVASDVGEVEETFAREGQTVEADSPALRLRPPGFRATFELPRNQAAPARRLAFCQVEVEGYSLDCSLVPAAGNDRQVTVALPSVPPALVGKPAHLVRARYRSGVVLPTSALQTSGTRTAVLVMLAGARPEARPVVVADRDAMEAVVIQGLDPGDQVVIEPSPGPRPGVPVASRP
jgi:multidrug efflux pump subunit AcrA (membrane-fusion protein)